MQFSALIGHIKWSDFWFSYRQLEIGILNTPNTEYTEYTH